MGGGPVRAPQTSTRARGPARLIFHFGLTERPNSALLPAQKLHRTRSGSVTSPGTDRLAFEGSRPTEQAYSLTGGPACATCGSVWVLCSPPWLPTQPKRQTTGTARWMGYVRCPGACFCDSLGGLEGFSGARKPAWPSLAVSGRVDFLGGPARRDCAPLDACRGIPVFCVFL